MLIEPEYNASNLDKDEWVKEWKKQGNQTRYIDCDEITMIDY